MPTLFHYMCYYEEVLSVTFDVYFINMGTILFKHTLKVYTKINIYRRRIH